MKKIKKIFSFAASKMFYIILGIAISLTIFTVQAMIDDYDDVAVNAPLTSVFWNNMVNEIKSMWDLENANPATYIETDKDVGIKTAAAPGAALEVNGNIITDIPIDDNHAATRGWVNTQISGAGGYDPTADWTLVAVANSVSGDTGIYPAKRADSSDYKVTAGSQVLIVLIASNFGIDLATDDVVSVFEGFASGYVSGSYGFAISTIGNFDVNNSTQTSVLILGRKLTGLNQTYIVDGQSSTSQWVRMDGEGLIELSDQSATSNGGLYIFER